MAEVATLRPSQLVAALRTCVETKQPAVIWGPPGIGKSDIVRQVATSMEMDYRDIRAVLLDPVDLRGLPTISADGTTRWATPEFMPKAGKGVVVLEELNRAAVMVQNACFQLVLDRQLGEYTLPKDWAIIAACNREEDGGGITRMPQALANRFLHINLEPDLDEWCQWAITHDIDPLIIAFLRFRSNLLHAFDRNEHAFPTPRSWAFVSRILQHTTADLELPLIAGAVGYGAAVEFMSFLKLYRDMPSIDAILLTPDAAKVPEDVATLYAVSSALAAKATDTNLGRVITYLDRIPAEYAVYSIKDAVLRDPLLQTNNSFTQWAVSHSQLLR